MINDELIRFGRQAIKRRFINWRLPSVELPADSVIDAAVEDIIHLVIQDNSDVEPDG